MGGAGGASRAGVPGRRARKCGLCLGCPSRGASGLDTQTSGWGGLARGPASSPHRGTPPQPPLPISGSPSTLHHCWNTHVGGSPAPRTCNHSYSGMGNTLLEVVFANKEPCSQTPDWAGSRGRRGVRGRGRAREEGCLQVQFNAAASEADSRVGENPIR